jgi:K+-sensing histidine kinase KdpD
VRTRQAVMALVKNAVEHAPDRTTVTVELSGDRRRLDLCVLDESEGIAPDDAFARSASYLEATHTADPSHGRGLGLAVAEAVAQAHGGELVLSGNLPAGLCARMTLPRDGMRLVG